MSGNLPKLDLQMMRRAVRLAMNGRGDVEPNPMVGCVLVKNGRIIGEGASVMLETPEGNAILRVARIRDGAVEFRYASQTISVLSSVNGSPLKPP